MVHEDAEVVAEERARNAQRPRRSDDKELTEREQDSGDYRRVFLGQDGFLWLVKECPVVADAFRQILDDLACEQTHRLSRTIPNEKMSMARKYVP